MGKILLRRNFFAEKESTIYKDDMFEASIFCYESGVPAVRLKNSMGYLIILPYHGQMIWEAVFDGKPLGMQTTYREPKLTEDFLNTYGCYLMYCGPRRICLDTVENHPLHGELPLAPYDRAWIELGSDDLGTFIAMTGEYEYNRLFGDHYVAQPVCRLYADSSILRVTMQVTNMSAKSMDFMYLFHINNPAREGARFVQPLRWNAEDMELLCPAEDAPMPEESAVERKRIMADYKESMCLKDNVQYAPEFSIRLNNLVPDEDNFAHFMQIHADGGADYTAVKLGGALRHFSRWVTRTKDHSACCVCAPVSCQDGGYTVEKQAGRVIVMDPGEEITMEVRIGYLREADAAAMEQKIAALVQKKENERAE